MHFAIPIVTSKNNHNLYCSFNEMITDYYLMQRNALALGPGTKSPASAPGTESAASAPGTEWWRL